MRQLLPELQDVFRRVFDDSSLAVDENTTAAEVDGWDSMAHIKLVLAIEKRFGVKFTGADLATLTRNGQSVGILLDLIEARAGQRTEVAPAQGPA